MLGAFEVGVQDAHAADEDGHFGRGEGQQLGLIDEQCFGRDGVFGLEVIAEAVGDWFEDLEVFDIGLVLRGIHAAGGEGNCHVLAGVFSRLFDGCATGQNDEVGQ